MKYAYHQFWRMRPAHPTWSENTVAEFDVKELVKVLNALEKRIAELEEKVGKHITPPSS